MKHLWTYLLFASLFIIASCDKKSSISTLGTTDTLPLSQIKLPPGFHISIFGRIPYARSLAIGANGTVFVGTKQQGGNVYALVDANNDGIAEKTYLIASGLNEPNGVAFRGGALYVAEINKVWRIDNIENNLAHPGQHVLVSNDFPSNLTHGWRYIGFGPDDKLYVAIGDPCNACDSAAEDARFASIVRMNADGSGFETFAKGIRNSVGFDWQPQTNKLWFTDNGRDDLGDYLPSDELNYAPNIGMNFGFPYCEEGDIPDTTFGAQYNCDEFTPPVLKLGAHVASLGMKFYTGKMFPQEYNGQMFIAEHGSTSSTILVGYRVVSVQVTGGQVISSKVFAEGWLQGNTVWGRPVDLLQLKDGSLLLSDDLAGAVYRITYKL
jgi:glucose/arabinose dehydrogenase